MRVQSPEVYRLDFTGEHSGDQDTLDSCSMNGEASSPATVRKHFKDGCENVRDIPGDKVCDMNKSLTDHQDATASDTRHSVDNSKVILKSDPDINEGKISQGPQVVVSDSNISKEKSKEVNPVKMKHSPGHKASTESMEKDTKSVRRRERTPKHSKKKGRISAEEGKGDLKQEDKKEVIDEKAEDLTKTDRYVVD